jgi:hypothetical protein
VTREQAQEILLLHRANGAIEQDAEMSEALRFAASDPELAKWLELHREFQANVARELAAIEPPADLKAKILAGVSAIEKPISQKAARGWRRRQILAIAAAIILLATLTGLLATHENPDAPTFANFRSRMTSFALRTYAMDVVTNNPAAVRDFLKTHGAPADFSLTPQLARLPVKGGGRLSWQNQPVAMMCFGLTNNQTAFMFVIDEHALNKQPPRFDVEAGKNFSSVAWTKEGKLYLLAAAEPADVLTYMANP